MRNTVISVISILLIAAYSVFSLLYSNWFCETMEDKIEDADKNGYNIESIEKLNDYFDDNRDILALISSKDYIDTIEECIVNMYYASQFNDYQMLLTNKTILLKTTEDMDAVNKSPI